MKLRHTLLLLVVLVKNASAKPDSAFLRCPTFLGEYKIILNENGFYLKENYRYFKYMYGLASLDTLTIQEFNKLHDKHSWRKRYKQYSICDSVINRIRNEGSMAVVFSEEMDIADAQLGKDNSFSRNHVFHWLLYDNIYQPFCYPEYKKIEVAYKEKWLRQIDSLKTAIKCIQINFLVDKFRRNA